MQQILAQFPEHFSSNTGKFKGDPVKIHVRPNANPVVQPPRRIPLHYVDQLRDEIIKMVDEDIIECPLETEEPGTYISNLVITDKKWDPKRIRVTLVCQQVNKDIYQTHEPIPTTEELRNKLEESNRFSVIDITNCYYLFEIEPEARKLHRFRSPWEIYRFKRMVIGTSPASSEIQKRVREAIKDCKNAISIKDDILAHGKDNDHDKHLIKVLKILSEKGLHFKKRNVILVNQKLNGLAIYIYRKRDATRPSKMEDYSELATTNILWRSEKFSTDRAIQCKIFIRKRK